MSEHYSLPTHKRDQLSAGLRDSTDAEIAAVVGSLRGIAESFEALQHSFTSAEVASILRTAADQFVLMRPKADPS